MAIAYNSTSIINEQAASSTTLTWAHTCNASDTKLVVVAGGRQTISGITYNGVAMTVIATETSGYEKNALYYLDSPATGSAYNIVVTYSSSSDFRTGLAIGLSGAMAGVGNSTTQANYSATTSTLTLTTGTANSDVLYMMGANTVDGVTVTGATEITKNTANNWAYFGYYENTTTAGNYAATIQRGTAANFASLAVELKIAVASGPANLKSRSGNVKANIKSMSGNTLANIKSLSGNS